MCETPPMSETPPTTTIAPTEPLAHQVGGHAGVHLAGDGELLIKPALPLEARFYEAVAAEPRLAPLRPFVPRFLGTLALAGQTTPAGAVVQDVPPELAAQKDRSFPRCGASLVLENLAHAFEKPNILDAKLGTVLFDGDALPEKRARMEAVARATTSATTGVRLTGFQVFDNATGAAVVTGKEYGKALAPAELPAGIARFFPVADPDARSEEGGGLPAAALLSILERLVEDVREIREAVAGVEMRMVGASLLVVYEADWARAAEGVEWLGEHPGGMEMCEDEDEEEDEEEEEEEEEGKPGPPYAVKLIDFAHTQLRPGEGPDEGVLKGLDTIVRLLEGRIEEVRKAVGAEA